MKVRILSSALNDLVAGREFYERQGAGLGDYFFDSVFADIDSLALYGGIHVKVFGCHRRLASRFPYAIYYRMGSSGEVIVHRVLDCRQDPARTRIALKGIS
jgi:plasmid stabilization system protein ParE